MGQAPFLGQFTTEMEQECTRTAGMTVNCVKWETVEYDVDIVHVDDMCEGARCDSRP